MVSKPLKAEAGGAAAHVGACEGLLRAAALFCVAQALHKRKVLRRYGLHESRGCSSFMPCNAPSRAF